LSLEGEGGGGCHSTEEDEEDCCFSFSFIILHSLPTTKNQYQVYLPPAALGLGLLLVPDAGCWLLLLSLQISSTLPTVFYSSILSSSPGGGARAASPTRVGGFGRILVIMIGLLATWSPGPRAGSGGQDY
jgi:hypothetical protein